MPTYYRYYQEKEKSKWILIEDSAKAVSGAVDRGAKRMTVLALSSPSEEVDPDKTLYRGPFYVDIDQPEITSAIASAKEFLGYLRQWSVHPQSFQIFCSGKKGFHFILHQKLFMSRGAGVKYLPKIYKLMATTMYVLGLDFQPYAMGRGNVFRLPDVQREDGRYKVQITPEELDELDEEKYQDLCSRPRNIQFMPIAAPPDLNPQLVQRFGEAKEMLKREEKERIHNALPDGALAPFQTSPPACVNDLAQGNLRIGISFNQAAYQTSIFLARAACSQDVINSTASLLAEKTESATYGSQRERRNHVLGVLKHVQSKPSRKFSCPAMRSVLSTRPCEGCEIYSASEELSETYLIQERPDGYYIEEGKADRRLTSFLLTPHQAIYGYGDQETNHEKRREYIVCSVEIDHSVRGIVKIPESAWSSRSAFLPVFHGLSNLKITASENDLQNLKHWVLRDLEEVDNKTQVTSLGIHREVRNRKPRYIWVEEDLSVDKYGLKGTHILSMNVNRQEAGMPSFAEIKPAEPEDEKLIAGLDALFQMNRPDVMGTILGWMGACFVKEHLMGRWRQFPLLNLWGGRGSAKTTTACLAASICGCDYRTYGVPSAPSVTQYSVMMGLSSTTTVPKVFDEFNAHGMPQNKHQWLAETFKAGFNNNIMQRGRLSRAGDRSNGGAVVESIRLTAPICYLSEHIADMPALNDRSMHVMMGEPYLIGRQHYMETVLDSADSLARFARSAVTTALRVRDEWVQERMLEWKGRLPKALTERQLYARQVIGTGLDFLRRVMEEDLKLGMEPQLQELEAGFMEIASVDDNEEAGVYSKTEVTRMLVYLAELAHLTAADMGYEPRLPPSVAMKYEGNLYLDPALSLALLKIHIRKQGDRPPITSSAQFSKLLEHEPYVKSKSGVMPSVPGKSYFVLDLDEMAKANIDTSGFTG